MFLVHRTTLAAAHHPATHHAAADRSGRQFIGGFLLLVGERGVELVDGRLQFTQGVEARG